jgi:transglutaminase-like putative cysteine protease
MAGLRDRGVVFSMRVMGGTLGGVWERERRDTLFLLGAIALAIGPQLFNLPLWCAAGFAVLFLWRTGLVFSGRPLPGKVLCLAAAAACTAGVLAQYGTLFGREAGVALLVLFLGLKLMEMRARRDHFVVIFLSFFVLVTGFFESQSMFAAALSMIAVVGLLAALLTMQFGQREVSLRQRLTTVGVMLLQALPLAAALFVLFPRINGPLWGLPGDAHSASTGMSDTMSPGQISDLTNNDEVAFRVQFEGGAPAQSQMYWRGPTLGHFDGKVWRAVRADVVPRPAAQATLPEGGKALRYQTTLEPHSGRWLFALDVPASVPSAPALAVSVSPDFDMLAADRVATRTRFDATARLDASIGLNETPLSLQNWLQLPPGHHRRTLELAARWRNEEADNGALVQRTLSMFRDADFRYTLNPPLLEDNPVDRFLFETRAGFCEHYASAFVVLMRALDIPARVVTGYQGGEANPGDDYWIVRQSDAHAWAEVWLDGKGWMRVDPTSAVAPERIEKGSAALSRQRGLGKDGLPSLGDLDFYRQLRFSIDAFSHGWNQWVLSYDSGRQKSLLGSIGLDSTQPQEIAAALGVVLALAIAGVALTTLRPQVKRDEVERAYDLFCARVAAIGAPRLLAETASRYLERIDPLLEPDDADLAREIVETYSQLRYDPQTSSPTQVRDLQRLVKAFKP